MPLDLGGTTLIVLKNDKGIYLAIDGLAGDKFGYTEPANKIGVLCARPGHPNYLSCLMSGSSVACNKAIKAAIKADEDRGSNVRMSVREFALAMCRHWETRPPPLSTDGEDVVSTVVVGGFDRNIPQVWYARITHGSRPFIASVIGSTFFSGSGETISGNVFRSYHDHMEWPEIRNLVREAMIETSKPCEPNMYNVRLVKCGGVIQVHLIRPNNSREVKLYTELDDLKQEVQAEARAKRKEDKCIAREGSSSSRR